jgi:hypothetical protein
MSASLPDFTIEDQASAWERIIKIENLNADTALKNAQVRLVPWQIATAAFTAGGAFVGAIVALVAIIAHGHWN